MKPATVATRDNLLAALRNAARALSTTELAAELAWTRLETPHEDGWHRDTTRRRLIRCEGATDLVELAQHAPSVYPHLRALHRAGLVGFARAGQQAFWTALTAAAVTVADLEAMWRA